jgi:hypothetical protein
MHTSPFLHISAIRIYKIRFWTPDSHTLYLLTTYSTVLLQKLTGFAANQEIHCILWNPKVHYRTHKHPPRMWILHNILFFTGRSC